MAEKRLIDANALLTRLASSSESWAKNLQDIRNWWPHAVGIKDNIVGVINDMPTVDAVEVVRCKDCIELNWTERCDGLLSGTVRFYCPYANGFVPLNHFCSYGERRNVGESGQNTQKNVGRREGE